MAQVVNKKDELKIIVLGFNLSGKTATINTFLGVAESPGGHAVTHSVKREGVVQGRKITLIDTAGWWWVYSANQTPEYIKRELVLSVSLCPPGPHAFILVVELDNQFTETEKKSVEEHLEFLGANIWEHTIVLFSKGDLLMGKTIEERIKSEEEMLWWLVERCGGRYHVFDNTKNGDQYQVKTLLEKIDGLIDNHHHPYEVDHNKVKSTEEAKKADRESGLKYKQKVLRERERIKSHAEVASLSEIKILLVGWTFSGKSYSGNIILDRDHFSPGKVKEMAESAQGKVFGRNLIVVDTPGWWKFLPAKYTPTRVKTQLQNGVDLCGRYPHTILLTVTADTSFRKETRIIIQDTLEKYLGEDVWRHILVLFTWCQQLKETTIEEFIESEPDLKWLVQKCGHRYHTFSQRGESSNQVEELLEKIEEMVAGNSVFCPHAESRWYTQAAIKRYKVGKDEPWSEDAIDKLDREWLQRDKRVIEEVQQVWVTAVEAARKQKSNVSLDEPPFLSTEQDPMDTVNYEETSQGNSPHGAATDDQAKTDDQTLHRQQSDDETFAGHVKDLLEKEWKRRDFIVRDLIRKAVKELQVSIADMTSEPGEQEVQRSIRKVDDWHKRSSGLGSEFDSDDEG